MHHFQNSFFIYLLLSALRAFVSIFLILIALNLECSILINYQIIFKCMTTCNPNLFRKTPIFLKITVQLAWSTICLLKQF